MSDKERGCFATCPICEKGYKTTYLVAIYFLEQHFAQTWAISNTLEQNYLSCHWASQAKQL